MSKFVHGVNRGKHRTFLKWFGGVIGFVILLLALIAAALYYDMTLEQRVTNTPSSSSTQESVIESSAEVFTSEYFQFQTDKNWRHIVNESSGNKYVYRKGPAHHIDADMTVYINTLPATEQLSATRILPVTFEDGTLHAAGSVSEHCQEKVPKNAQGGIIAGELELSLSQTTFLCDADGTNYTVAVGLVNGKQQMDLPRRTNERTIYFIYFRDLRFTPEPAEFVDIINSFQVR